MAAVRPNGSLPSRGRRFARGAAAVEFILVAPIFLAIIGCLFTVGMALMTKYRLYGVAAATVRACTAMQQTGDNEATLQACVNSQYPVVIQTQGGGQLGCLSQPVMNAPMPIRIQTQGNAVSSSTKSIVLVQAQLSCNVSVLPLLNVLGGLFPNQMEITALSAVPFVIGRR